MILFEKPGRGNTEKTLQIAVDKAESLDAEIGDPLFVSLLSHLCTG